MKPLIFTKRVAVAYEEAVEEWSVSKILDVFHEGDGSLVYPLLMRVLELEEALSWYADPNNYNNVPIVEDGGKRANIILNKESINPEIYSDRDFIIGKDDEDE